MPHYLFTNDNRTSDFPNRLVKSAKNIREKRDFDYSTPEGKSEGNVTATNGFYFNLKPGSETLILAETNPIECIRNFVLKFQYPNTREKNEYGLELADQVQLAPYRVVVRILVQMGYFHDEIIPKLSQGEILYYVFGNKEVYQNKTSNYQRIIAQIYEDRTKGFSNYDLTGIKWKQVDRQIREMMKFLVLACSAFKYDRGILSFDKSKISEEKDAEFISRLLNYNIYWSCPNVPFSIANESYSKYMDIDKDWRAPYLVIKNDSETIYSDEELSRILRDNFDSNRKVAICNLFGLRYGETISDYDRKHLINIVRNSGILKSPDDSENSLVDYIINGRNVYDGIKNGDLGLRFYDEKMEDNQEDQYQMPSNNTPLQIIYYGTPGSGKSHKVKQDYDENYPKDQVIRTTFHPDTDYASFVGGYKPVATTDNEGNEKITYRFIPQCFTEAYVRAWNDLGKPYFLIIEEINRGNCAQIFGDTFQLLDRNDNGYSEYPIDADADLNKYLEEDGALTNEAGIANGQLCLPPNLSIIATMNTSDQSLFPMDTAFKRRWAWEYVPIEYDNKKSSEFKITIGEETFDWPVFMKAINKEIKRLTSSEDKQMGNFFIKHSVDEKEFVNKVMYYLWSEVGKDNYQTSDALFLRFADSNDGSKTDFSFNELYEEGSTQKLLDFMRIIIDGNKK